MDSNIGLSDTEFERQFAMCKLDPAIINHGAHLRLAWIHIDKYGLEKAKENIQKQLQDFVAHIGAKDKYHQTLTMSAVNHFKEQSKSDNFNGFIIEFSQLKNNFKALIASHYSFDIFKSIRSKTEFIAPDLLPFK